MKLDIDMDTCPTFLLVMDYFSKMSEISQLVNVASKCYPYLGIWRALGCSIVQWIAYLFLDPAVPGLIPDVSKNLMLPSLLLE